MQWKKEKEQRIMLVEKKKKERQVMVEEKMGMTGIYSDDTSFGINMEQKFTEQH